MGQRLSKAGDKFRVAGPAELAPCPVRLQQGLLDNIGGIHLAPQPPIELGLGQQMQVRAKTFQLAAIVRLAVSQRIREVGKEES